MPLNPSITGKSWNLRGERLANESLFAAFCRVRGLSAEFLRESGLSDLQNPSLVPGVAGAAERVIKALENREKILIFGDFDLDGMSGSAILHLALRALSADVVTRLPGRHEGYGLSRDAYDQAHKAGAKLVITVDCGCSNGGEIAYGNTLGIDTVVTDHHTLPKKLPPAVAIAHPHLGTKGDDSWELTGAGVAFFLALALFQKRFPDRDLQQITGQLAELALLGTVADVGRLSGQNRVIVQYGLRHLRRTRHPGLLALLRAAKLNPVDVTAEAVAFALAPRLNAAGRMAHPDWALQLLIGDPRYAAYYSEHLEVFNLERREKTDRLVQLAESEIDGQDLPFYAIFHEDFSPGIAGLIAARLAEKYCRPAIALSPADDGETLTASCRGPEDFHLAEALREVSHLLHKYGGHRCAAGFSLPKKNLEAFREAFTAIVLKRRGQTPPISELTADLHASGEDFFSRDFAEIFKAAPFGAGNPEPLFWMRDVRLAGVRPVGKNGDHLIGGLAAGSDKEIPFVAFRMASFLPPARWGQKFDVLVHAEQSVWNGKKTLKLKVADARENK